MIKNEVSYSLYFMSLIVSAYCLVIRVLKTDGPGRFKPITAFLVHQEQ